MKNGQHEKWSKLKVVKIKSGKNEEWSKLRGVKFLKPTVRKVTFFSEECS